MRSAIVLTGVSKRHGRGDSAVHALADVSLELGSGSFTAIMGPSGSVKTTLLQCAAGLDRPDSGSVLAPCSTARATLVAVGSFTARLPVSVVCGT